MKSREEILSLLRQVKPHLGLKSDHKHIENPSDNEDARRYLIV